uniref:Uncharacterized protein n=1 Tax=Nelumbo nucifera TaxID=4432 RepID=A0A822YTR6_NELNU|nr:TPA_asm: hypothetical protein HUJ06_006567 [Nelumbo nucifera]
MYPCIFLILSPHPCLAKVYSDKSPIFAFLILCVYDILRILNLIQPQLWLKTSTPQVGSTMLDWALVRLNPAQSIQIAAQDANYKTFLRLREA